MANLYYDHDHLLVSDLIDDPIVPLAHTVSLLSRQLVDTDGSRIFGQRVNAGENLPKIPIRDSTQIPGNGFAEDDPISSHASSGPSGVPRS
jgi:hypothetical protein